MQFGWSLPPGVSDRMIDDAYGPPPPPQPRCGHCGRFIGWKVEREEHWEDGLRCDGKTKAYVLKNPVWVVEQYDIPATYEERLAPCGDSTDHDPHVQVMAVGIRLFRRCSCGHVTEEVQG